MSILDTVYLGNPLSDLLVALCVTLIILFGSSSVLRITVRRLSALAGSTETEVDDFAAEVLKRTRWFFLLAVSAYVGAQYLTLTVTIQRILNILIMLAILAQGGLWVNAATAFWLNRSMKRKLTSDAASATTLAALGFLSRLVVWSVVALLALDNLGVNITALVTGLGIGGIAVALALQRILGDLFASLSIVLDKPFVIGDFIIVNELLGTVEHIGLKTTRIRSLSGEQIVFSNSDLLASRIRNFKRMYERRVVFTIGVTYQTPYEKLATIGNILREIVESQKSTRFDRAHFKEYADSSLTFEIVYFVLTSDFNTYMDIQQAINLAIYRRFEKEGIQFAYPTRTVYIGDSNNPEDHNGRREHEAMGQILKAKT